MFIPVLLRYRKKAEKRNVFRPYFGGIMTLHEQNHEIFISPERVCQGAWRQAKFDGIRWRWCRQVAGCKDDSPHPAGSWKTRAGLEIVGTPVRVVSRKDTIVQPQAFAVAGNSRYRRTTANRVI